MVDGSNVSGGKLMKRARAAGCVLGTVITDFSRLRR
jgi:hypothetical protein